MRVFVWFAFAASLVGSLAIADEAAFVERLDGRRVPKTAVPLNARLGMEKDNGRQVLEVRCKAGEQSGVILRPAEDSWDWTGRGGVAFDVSNQSASPMALCIRIDSLGESGREAALNRTIAIAPNTRRTVPISFTRNGAGPYWGMRGIPEFGPVTRYGFDLGELGLDLKAIKQISLFVKSPQGEVAFRLSDLRLFETGSATEWIVPNPFIDRYGQYVHADWPGKVHSDDELKDLHAKEDAELAAAQKNPELDEYCGWLGGPQLEATGRFRVEKVDGKWWFVTPTGRLFLSLGMDCVHPGNHTFVEGRKEWFEWIPEDNSPFAEFMSNVNGVHSMAEPINGKGHAFNFNNANIKRVYGDAWSQIFYERADKRLRAWGFNTIAFFTPSNAVDASKLPYIAGAGTSSNRVVEGSKGYWGKMKDVFDPSFETLTVENVVRNCERYKDDPRVIGYFVDNELSWSGIPMGALDSPPDQPARVAFIDDLKAKYGTIDKVNAAWETNAKDWDSLRLPSRVNDATQVDAGAFEYRFARKYFETVGNAIHKYAPGQLYMGCRFTLVYFPKNVVRACAEVVDVISINAYITQIAPDQLVEYGKPVIIGEFHFGALDRGMFHTGLRTADNQAHRAQRYQDYVRSVATNPAFIGCHWFQYTDQPATGRTGDGENYNIGFVNVADIPYAEMVDAAKKIHGEAYKIRSESNLRMPN
ncbi:MAG: beta-galactosidase [Candidatus Hydrogenedentales bacterium]|jgi:hypothetical protein